MDVTKLSDFQLIKIIRKTSDSNAYLELKKRNEKCYFSTLASYCKKVPQLNYIEMAERVDEVILKSLRSYRKNKKTKFSSWCTSHSRYFILNNLKELNNLGKFVPTENTTIDLLNNTQNKIHLDSKEDFKDHIFSILKTLPDKRAYRIFQLRYYSDKQSQKWAAIAKELNLSVQQTVNIYNSAKKILYKNMVEENNK